MNITYLPKNTKETLLMLIKYSVNKNNKLKYTSTYTVYKCNYRIFSQALFKNITPASVIQLI